MQWWQAIILAVVQGLTEFLPVSSSGHLVLAPRLLGWRDQGLAFDVAVHVGTLLGVLVYFRRDLGPLVSGGIRFIGGERGDPYSRLAFNLVVATIPVGNSLACDSAARTKALSVCAYSISSASIA